MGAGVRRGAGKINFSRQHSAFSTQPLLMPVMLNRYFLSRTYDRCFFTSEAQSHMEKTLG